MLDWIIFPLITIIIFVLLYFQFKKLSKLSAQRNTEVKEYGKNLLSGIVAGIVVVILDKGMTALFQSPPKIDYSSLKSIVVSGVASVIVFLFEIGLLMLLVIYVINKGLEGTLKKKKK